MSDLDLLRIGSDETGTRGVLRINGLPFAVTLELPWKNNEQEHSCIPAAFYICRRVFSPHFKETFQIMDVPNRDKILFHKGNTTHDTKGCVLVGEKFADLSVGESGEGYAEFMAKLEGRAEFTLSIIDINKYLPGGAQWQSAS